jgi:predicted DNA-binding transcriptional regulator YafY
VRNQLVRLWRIVMLLGEQRYGLRSVQLAERLEVSRATIDRDLQVLSAAGCAIESELTNGEVRHRFTAKPLPPLQPTMLQAIALQLARVALTPLSGTRLVRELDALIAQIGAEPMQRTNGSKRSKARNAPSQSQLVLPLSRHGALSLQLAAGSRAQAAVVRTLDDALEHGRRVELRYRAASRRGATRVYTLDPITLRVIDGDVYLGAFDHGARAPRRFKLSRIEQATFLEQPADPHPNLNDAVLFGGSLKAWGGELQTVTVVLKSDVAWLAREYPLSAEQVVEPQPDGSLQIRAHVAGLVETQQWLLRWGSKAVAIAPPELRKMVGAELQAAAKEYARPGLKATRRRRPSELDTNEANVAARVAGTRASNKRVPDAAVRANAPRTNATSARREASPLLAAADAWNPPRKRKSAGTIRSAQMR